MAPKIPPLSLARANDSQTLLGIETSVHCGLFPRRPVPMTAKPS